MISFFKSLDYTFWKADRKRTKRLEKARLARHKRLVESLDNDRIRREIYARDKGKCRVCGTPLRFQSPNLFDVIHAHHIEYASAGGSDEAHNRVALCFDCHQKEHAHILAIDGDPRETLRIIHLDKDTREVVREQYSPCP